MGSLMELIAFSRDDVYLTNNPQITFFKVVKRRDRFIVNNKELYILPYNHELYNSFVSFYIKDFELTSNINKELLESINVLYIHCKSDYILPKNIKNNMQIYLYNCGDFDRIDVNKSIFENYEHEFGTYYYEPQSLNANPDNDYVCLEIIIKNI